MQAGPLRLEPFALGVEPDGVARRNLKSLLTERLGVVLEERSVRLAAVGILLVASSALALISTPTGIDYGWMFVVPIAISAIAVGIGEGLVVAFAAALLFGMFFGLVHGYGVGTVLGTVAARGALYGLIAAFLGVFAEAHRSVQTKLRRLASIDPLTKVDNVSSLYEHCAALEAESAVFAMLVVDVDDLKKVNDTHGHQAGSEAIMLVADVLRRAVRASDQVARYGGDEFVAVLRNADAAGAQVVANRVCRLLATARLEGYPDLPVTVSVGVALYGKDGVTAQELLAAADRAMYVDKRTRDRTVVLR
jgi:diguanylate cyclase (GGDEF)-like protein